MYTPYLYAFNIFFSRLKQLLTIYRVQFDFVDVVLANATSLKTAANFTTLWDQQFINQGIKQISH